MSNTQIINPQHSPYVLSKLNEQGQLPPLLEGIETIEQWQAKAERVRQVWLAYVGGLPARPPLNLQIVSESHNPDYACQEIVYDTVYGDRIPAYLLVPHRVREQGGRHPAILALHPTNVQGKSRIAIPAASSKSPYGHELAMRGYIVLVPDAMTAGDRIFPGQPDFHDAPFYERHPEWTTVGKNLVDHMQGLDLLTQHELVDPERIGAIGHSFGAYNSYFLAGVDERVRVYAASCGFSPFTGSAEPGHWGIRDWYTHLPKVQDDLDNDRIPFEFHEIVALAAPTPAFFYNGQSDRIFPHWPSIGQGMVQLHQLYRFLKADDRFFSVLGAGEHGFPKPIRRLAYDFLDQWLDHQPCTASSEKSAEQ